MQKMSHYRQLWKIKIISYESLKMQSLTEVRF